MLSVAHLSDPHVGPLPAARVLDLCNKRVLGYLSWKLRRAAVHLDDVLGMLVRDLHGSRPDHIVVTGDITNIALPEEFEQAGRWLSELGSAQHVSVVPGNHDAYVRVSWPASLGLWGQYMSSDAGHDGQAPQATSDFPFVRIRGNVAFVGVSTARPMSLFVATGKVGDSQLARLERVLDELGTMGLVRVVLMHHPPHAGAVRPRKRLVDAQAFRDVIDRAGAELVLHGHAHQSTIASLETARGSVPIIGAPSASVPRHADDEHYSRYHLYRFVRTNSGWGADVEIRGLTPDARAFAVERSFRLVLPSDGSKPSSETPT